jgi:polyisoprenoid-binding protein YceI
MLTHTNRAPLAGTWTIEPRNSQVSIAVQHALVGPIRGRFTDLEGQLHLDADMRRCRGVLLIDAASVHTGPPAQDQWLRSPAFLDTAAYHYIWLHTTRVAVDPAGPPNQVLVTGELVVRAVARPIRAVFRLRAMRTSASAARARLIGRISLSRADFGLGTGHDTRRGSALLGDRITVDLDLGVVRRLAADTTRASRTSSGNYCHGDIHGYRHGDQS